MCGWIPASSWSGRDSCTAFTVTSGQCGRRVAGPFRRPSVSSRRHQTLLNQTARGKGPALAEWQVKSLQGIDLATARQVTALAEDLLDVTHVRAGRLELQREPTDAKPMSLRCKSTTHSREGRES